MIDLTKDYSITFNDKVLYEKVGVVVLPNTLLMVLHANIKDPLIFRDDSQTGGSTYLGELDVDGDIYIDDSYKLVQYCEAAKKQKERMTDYNATLNSLARIVEKM
jgi:hypothetical protein